jgi:hypothetical protein
MDKAPVVCCGTTELSDHRRKPASRKNYRVDRAVTGADCTIYSAVLIGHLADGRELTSDLGRANREAMNALGLCYTP